MAAIGSLKMGILVRVGEGEPIEMGVVTVPLSVSVLNGNVLHIDMGEVVGYVRESLMAVFGGAEPTFEETKA